MCLTCVVCCIHPHDPPLVYREMFSPPSGRCSSLPTPGGNPASLPDEEVLAVGRHWWTAGVSEGHPQWKKTGDKDEAGVFIVHEYRCVFSIPLIDLFFSISFSAPVTISPCHSHTVNLLTALPLQCLDVLLMVPLQPNSEQCQGVNMDCVHTLIMFMERRLDSVLWREAWRNTTESCFLTHWHVTWIHFFLVCLNLRVIRWKRSSHRYSICWQRAAGPTEKHAIISDNM